MQEQQEQQEQQEPQEQQEQEEEQKQDGTIVYKVEKILNRKNMKGERWFLIKWKNYPESESTWEPESNLESLKEDIIRFNANLSRSKSKKQKLQKNKKKQQLFRKDNKQKISDYLSQKPPPKEVILVEERDIAEEDMAGEDIAEEKIAEEDIAEKDIAWEDMEMVSPSVELFSNEVGIISKPAQALPPALPKTHPVLPNTPGRGPRPRPLCISAIHIISQTGSEGEESTFKISANNQIVDFPEKQAFVLFPDEICLFYQWKVEKILLKGLYR